MQSVGVLNVKCSTTPIFRILLLRYWVSFKVLFVKIVLLIDNKNNAI